MKAGQFLSRRLLVVPLGIVGVLLAATLFNQKMTSTLWWAC